MEKSWPCNIVHLHERYALSKHLGNLTGFPLEGKGDRALDCDQYDRCLEYAAVKNWESFHCENCTYEHRGAINFHAFEYVDIEDEDALWEDNDSDITDVQVCLDYQRFCIEDIYLTLMERNDE